MLPALIAAVLAPNAWWIARDRSPWPWDPSWYGQVSVDLWYYLSHFALRSWARGMLKAMYMKPPGTVWLGQFFVALRGICGSVETALLLSILLTHAALLLVVLRIGRAIAPDSDAVPALGVAIVASGRLFVGLSHQFFVEPLQALVVAWTILIAARAEEWRVPRTLLHLAAATILGALAKATTPVYTLLPCLYAAVMAIRKVRDENWRESCAEESRTLSGRWLAIGIMIAGPATAVWYRFNFREVWKHARAASSGDVALQYGSRASVASKLASWSNWAFDSFLAPYLGWLFLLAIVAGIAGFFVRRQRPGRSPIAAICAGQAALFLLILAMNDAEDRRFLYAMGVMLAVIAMSFMAEADWRVVWAAAFALCVAQFVAIHAVDLGMTQPRAGEYPLLRPPNPDAGRYREMERMVALTSTMSGRYNIVGVAEPWINANTASFFASTHRLDSGVRSFFTGLRYGATDTAAEWTRVKAFQPMYYISLDDAAQTHPPNFLNLVTRPVLDRVRADPHWERVPFASDNGIVIFRHR